MLVRQMSTDEVVHSGTFASEGTEGLETTLVSEFEFLILDVMLPGIDGIAILKRFRQHGNGTSIPLLTTRDTPTIMHIADLSLDRTTPELTRSCRRFPFLGQNS